MTPAQEIIGKVAESLANSLSKELHQNDAHDVMALVGGALRDLNRIADALEMLASPATYVAQQEPSPIGAHIKPDPEWFATTGLGLGLSFVTYAEMARAFRARGVRVLP